MSLGMPIKAFIGYPGRPNMRASTIREAARELTVLNEVEARTWEDLAVAGRLIISEIMAAIDESTVAAFDITNLNENVLFELGYSIGSAKRIWLLRDRTVVSSARTWERFGLLRTIGECRYENSDDIVAAFVRERPQDREDTVLDQLVEPSLRPSEQSSVLYLASPHDTDAERAIRRTLERDRSSSFSLTIADPKESATEPLSWYTASISSCRGVVAHLTSTTRKDADVHNARIALLSGLSVGLGKPVLMLAEEDYSSPIDYQDILHVYGVPKDATAHLTAWLHDNREFLNVPTIERVSTALRSALELRTLRLGAHVAEDEAADLGDYFVETRPYIDVLDGGTRLFVGRKGTGKTAVLLRAVEELSADARNIVCAIRPPGYELDGLLRLVRRYRDKDMKGYVIESMWKFLVYSELARVTVETIRQQRAVILPGSPEYELAEAVAAGGDVLSGDFAVRLERAVEDLLPVDVGSGLAIGRAAISEALHDTLIRDLRALLGRVLSGRHRVAILVDNLDKAWERDSDLPDLTEFLLGLLSAMRPIGSDLMKRTSGHQPVPVTLAVFLRSDIYWHLTQTTREPDKLAVSKLDWSDRQLLIRVLEERFAAVKGVEGSRIWSELFASDVEGKPAQLWLLDSILPRPRDLLYLANAAITNAVNRRHQSVDAVDLIDARFAYSSYAVESVLVEGEQDLPNLEDIMFEFAGSSSVVQSTEVLRRIARARPKRRTQMTDEDILVYLLVLSFLGVETSPGVPVYVDNPQDLARATAVALGRVGDQPLTYQVHPAFRTYLETT